ncbi:CHAT domain-containing tetratricopeptide repeat protein [Kibdelosporangium philippinense]|uniref:CHAT domain-containing tetratricopeptide repeat protein n=1 Tax=Kibdelosporangium philippinense TaxID=211113 RepID=A0ABS8ZUR5_9PSEU|nr:CHAT domain-containing tetratricopeptide repeat protein [Kibdelosporangium philippinense]MCE7011480.1 CHAT domain-containing tetratricopeptide repeat protein [Kibdelosporangium philippinense]
MVASHVEQALSYLDQAQGSTDLDVVDAAVDMCRQVADSVPHDDVDRPVYLHNLSLALRLRFERAGTTDDLEHAIAMSRTVLETATGGDPNISAYRHNLGMSLWLRFGRSNRREDLAEAIGIARRGMAGGEPGRTLCLTVLGLALYSRYKVSGSKPDLDEAISLIRSAVSQPALLSTLSTALLARFESSADPADLDEAIAAGLTATDAYPHGHPEWVQAVSGLCTSFRVRFEHARNRSDLDRSIGYGRAAVDARPSASTLGDLAVALQTLYNATGLPADLQAALDTAQAAVEVATQDDPARAEHLYTLGSALMSRYELVNVPTDLDEAIGLIRSAAGAARNDRARMLAHLMGALQIRFERTGALADLDEAIATGWEAVATTKANHQHLSNLAQALLRRYGRTGTQPDLDQALTLAGEAHAVVPLTERANVSNVVGQVLLARYERSGSTADLDGAISAFRGAASPSLGPALLERYRLRGIRADLTEALAIAEDNADPHNAQSLVDLAQVLRETSDLDEVISFSRAAVQATVDDDIELALRLSDLGYLLLEADEQDEAFTRFVESASVPLALPSIVVDSCWAAGSLIADSSPGRAANLMETAVRVAALSPTQPDDLTVEAAALALAAGSPSRALSILELGHGGRLSQTLGTRGDVVDLRAEYPDFARQFIDLRDQLSLPTDPSSAVHRASLAASFDATLDAIRALPGFEAFLLPVEVDLSAALDGPIAVLNVSRYRSDAILVTTAGITSIPLPHLTPRAVAARVAEFHAAVESSNQEHLHAILEWLWDVAAAPVVEALGFVDTPRAGWPRMWWVAHGPLNLLPLHAAGYHYSHGRSVLDRVISSYTPTIQALGHARDYSLPVPVSGALVVANLPHAMPEADAVRQHVPNSTLLINTEGSPPAHWPTRGNVLSHIDNCAIVHFACQGTGTSLLLDDAPLRIASLVPVQLTRARLAYLSACRTPAISADPIHLPTAFQLAGYPHVVGTLWEVTDSVTSFIAADFYSDMATTSDSALALHQAIRGIRTDIPHLPSMWAGYLHHGA